MKSPRSVLIPLLLALSVAANAALALVLRQATDRPERAGAGSRSAPELERSGEAADARRGRNDSARVERGPELPHYSTLLNGGDLSELAAALRRAGFPERVVIWIVSWKLDQDVFTKRRQELLGAGEARPFWEGRTQYFDPQRYAALRTWTRERRDALQRILGTDTWEREMGYEDSRLAFLAPEKAARARQIESDYSEMSTALQQEMQLARLPEDREKLRLMYEGKRADLAEFLSPEELELYDLHTSNTAANLRYSLGLFQPTEEEFRELYALRRVLDEKSGLLYGYFDSASFDQRQKDEQLLFDQVKELLGEERYAEYRRGQDTSFQAATKILQHFNLPVENAVQVYAVQQTINERAAKLMAETGTDRAAKQAAFKSLGAEAAAQIEPLLGAEGLAAFRQSGGGWLRTLERGSYAPPFNPTTVVIFGP